MGRFKRKYKWTERQEHFLILERMREIDEQMRAAHLYGKKIRGRFTTMITPLEYVDMLIRNSNRVDHDDLFREGSREGALDVDEGTTSPS